MGDNCSCHTNNTKCGDCVGRCGTAAGLVQQMVGRPGSSIGGVNKTLVFSNILFHFQIIHIVYVIPNYKAA